METQRFAAPLSDLSPALHHSLLPLDSHHLKLTGHSVLPLGFQLPLRVQKHSYHYDQHSADVYACRSHLRCCAVLPLQLHRQADTPVQAAVLSLPANVFVFSPLFLSIWPEDQRHLFLMWILTPVIAKELDPGLKVAYFFKRRWFLSFGHLPLLAFLHQRAGGVQRIMGNFVLLPG